LANEKNLKRKLNSLIFEKLLRLDSKVRVLKFLINCEM
jgi:hypothetical protein